MTAPDKALLLTAGWTLADSDHDPGRWARPAGLRAVYPIDMAIRAQLRAQGWTGPDEDGYWQHPWYEPAATTALACRQALADLGAMALRYLTLAKGQWGMERPPDLARVAAEAASDSDAASVSGTPDLGCSTVLPEGANDDGDRMKRYDAEVRALTLQLLEDLALAIPGREFYDRGFASRFDAVVQHLQGSCGKYNHSHPPALVDLDTAARAARVAADIKGTPKSIRRLAHAYPARVAAAPVSGPNPAMGPAGEPEPAEADFTAAREDVRRWLELPAAERERPCNWLIGSIVHTPETEILARAAAKALTALPTLAAHLVPDITPRPSSASGQLPSSCGVCKHSRLADRQFRPSPSSGRQLRCEHQVQRRTGEGEGMLIWENDSPPENCPLAHPRKSTTGAET